MVQEGSRLWQYLPDEQRVLLRDGEFLLADSVHHADTEPTDYSYIVFPYAKLYEGFLKQLLRDLDIIEDRDFFSEKFRIGKVLSPNMMRRLGKHSVYGIIQHKYGRVLADDLWHMWKEGRNQVFHYFPNNYRALTIKQATEIVTRIVKIMEEAVERTGVRRKTAADHGSQIVDHRIKGSEPGDNKKKAWYGDSRGKRRGFRTLGRGTILH